MKPNSKIILSLVLNIVNPHDILQHMRRVSIHSILAASLVFFFSTCSSSKHTSVKRHPKEVKHILLFQPLSAVYIIEKGNKQELDIDYSNIMMNNAWSGLEEILPRELDAQKLETDSIEQSEIADELFSLGAKLEKSITKKGMPVSEKIISVLHKHQFKYGIATISYGFTRTRKNYNNQMLMSLGISLLSAGIGGGAFALTYGPNKSNSTVISFIIDRENRSVAYYRKYSLNNEDPLNPEATENQLKSNMNTYFGNSIVKANNNY
jgi:hypothetical protein